MLSLTQGLGAKVALRALGMPKDGVEPAADLVVSNAYWNPRPLVGLSHKFLRHSQSGRDGSCDEVVGRRDSTPQSTDRTA